MVWTSIRSSTRAGRRYSSAALRRVQAVGSGSSSLRELHDAGGAEEFRAPALHEAQIIGVIDDAGEIGVFVIDADRQDMHLAVECARSPSFISGMACVFVASRLWRGRCSRSQRHARLLHGVARRCAAARSRAWRSMTSSFVHMRRFIACANDRAPEARKQ